MQTCARPGRLKPLGVAPCGQLSARSGHWPSFDAPPSAPIPYFMLGFTAVAVPIGLLCALVGMADLFHRFRASSAGAREQPPS